MACLSKVLFKILKGSVVNFPRLTQNYVVEKKGSQENATNALRHVYMSTV